MTKPLLILLIIVCSLITKLYSNEIESHSLSTDSINSCKSNRIMIAYQFGYTEIRSKSSQMPNDSGAFIGIHAMKLIEDSKFHDDLYFAAGAHKSFTEDSHIGVMLGIMYPINKKTMVSIMPGLIFMKHEGSHSNMSTVMDSMGMVHMNDTDNGWEIEEAIHTEVSYTIRFFNRIFNPSISWMSSSSHNQFSLGLNFHF